MGKTSVEKKKNTETIKTQIRTYIYVKGFIWFSLFLLKRKCLILEEISNNI